MSLNDPDYQKLCAIRERCNFLKEAGLQDVICSSADLDSLLAWSEEYFFLRRSSAEKLRELREQLVALDKLATIAPCLGQAVVELSHAYDELREQLQQAHSGALPGGDQLTISTAPGAAKTPILLQRDDFVE